MNLHKRVLLLSACLLMSGCATSSLQKQQQTANAPLVATGLITNELAKNLSIADAQKLQQLIFSSPAESSQVWENTEMHNEVQFTSLAITLNAQGQACRVYKINVVHRNKPQLLQTTACRHNDGTWYAITAAPRDDQSA